MAPQNSHTENFAFCPSACLFKYLTARLTSCFSIFSCLPAYLLACMPTSQSVNKSFYTLYYHVRMFVCMCLCVSVCRPVCLSVCIPICLFVCLPVWLLVVYDPLSSSFASFAKVLAAFNILCSFHRRFLLLSFFTSGTSIP